MVDAFLLRKKVWLTECAADIQNIFAIAHEYANLSHRSYIAPPDVYQACQGEGLTTQDLRTKAKKRKRSTSLLCMHIKAILTLAKEHLWTSSRREQHELRPPNSCPPMTKIKPTRIRVHRRDL